MSVTLSLEQKKMLNATWQWYKRCLQGGASNAQQGAEYITIGGYAGTGKTTSLGIFRAYLHKVLPKKKVAFASFTGKAARVLSLSVRSAGALYPKDFVGTLHSLLYAPIIQGNSIAGWQRKSELEYDLIIIDEASMLDEQLWRDARAFGVPIIAVGDHGQLPPIHGSFNLMQKPDLTLSEIHRQARDNPIIALSARVREQGSIAVGVYSDTVKKFSNQDYQSQDFVEQKLQSFNDDLLVLCGYNATRTKLNQTIRQYKGFQVPEPCVRDRVICLKNNHNKDIYNGMIGTIDSLDKHDDERYFARIRLHDGFSNAAGAAGSAPGAVANAQATSDEYTGLISATQFGQKTTLDWAAAQSAKGSESTDLFDFGYALTVHKAQGSQAPAVLLFEQRFGKMSDEDWRRWLYTAVTRAQSELYIIGQEV